MGIESSFEDYSINIVIIDVNKIVSPIKVSQIVL
jgi:hypothetical protein